MSAAPYSYPFGFPTVAGFPPAPFRPPTYYPQIPTAYPAFPATAPLPVSLPPVYYPQVPIAGSIRPPEITVPEVSCKDVDQYQGFILLLS